MFIMSKQYHWKTLKNGKDWKWIGNGKKGIIIDGSLEGTHKNGRRQHNGDIAYVTTYVNVTFAIMVISIISGVQFTIEMMNEVESED